MDRDLDPAIRRRRIRKRIVLALLAAAGAVALLMGASSLISPSVSRSMIRTARVDAGPIEATITASGTVVPEFEQVVSSPVDARVLKILKRPGAVLERGDPILDLDVSEARLAVERLGRSLALKDNEQARTRLELERTLGALAGQVEIKQLELQNLEALSERDRKLAADGLVSAEMLRQSALNQARAVVEVKQLEDSVRIARRATAIQIQGLTLEMATLRREKQEAERQLDLATTRSDRKGVLTYVVSEEGAAVRKGDVLARIADLTAFRVDATVSDMHASRLAAGMPAQVDVNGTRLAGTVTRILPTIQNGVVTLVVGLADPSNAMLRSNLRVDVQLLSDRKEKALRLKKGSFSGSEGLAEVFVVHGSAAVKKSVRLGVSSFDLCEVVSGLAEGDEVIVSDTSAIQHLKRVRIR